MKELVIAGDLYIFRHDLERYINHCKETKESVSIKGFNYYIKKAYSKEAK